MKKMLLMPGFVLAIFLTGCGSNNSSTQKENSAAFDSIKMPVYSGYTAVSVTHTVKNYNAWLKVYSEVSDPNSRISVFASPDDPNLITVFELTKSHKDARNSFSSDQIKKAMNEAGVISEPLFKYYDIKYRASETSDKGYRLGVTHTVSNYERWKKVFDEDAPVRAEAGLMLRAISTNEDDPLVVNVMFATNDIERAKSLIKSDDLKKRMNEAGVRSEPVLTVFKVP